jgi:hypothetical protein
MLGAQCFLDVLVSPRLPQLLVLPARRHHVSGRQLHVPIV